MDTRDRFSSEFRREAKARSLAFATDRKRGRGSSITHAELARRIGRDARDIRRILDPDHRTKIPALTAALAALGRRLVVGVEAA